MLCITLDGMNAINASHALDLLRSGQPLQYMHVDTLDLHSLASDDQTGIHVSIIARDSRIDALDSSSLVFHRPVIFERCHLGTAFCWATSFLAGAEFIECTFDGPVTFECGGHNEPPAAFVLNTCTFTHFVNFFDCWYLGPVLIRSCHFDAGSNLLGNVDQPFVTSFEIPPVIAGNTGTLSIDGG